MKVLAVAFTAVALVAARQALACSIPHVPSESMLSSYSQIFVGDVVAVHLVEYERERLREIAEGAERQVNTHRFGVTLDHSVRVLVTHSLKGTPEPITELLIGGCGVPVPQAGEPGLFFVPSDGRVAVVYQSDHRFSEWLIKATKHSRSDG
jgi:hypothetical protein